MLSKIKELFKLFWNGDNQTELSLKKTKRPSFQGGHHFMNHDGSYTYKRPR